MKHHVFAVSPLLGRIGRSDLDALVRAGEKRSFAPGAVLFQRGDAGDCLYAIVAGSVRVTVEGAAGDEVTVAVRGVGEVLGEMSLLDGEPRSATATAHGPVTAVRIEKAAFDRWLTAHPVAARAMLGDLARRLREATDQVAEIALLDTETRVALRLWRMYAVAARGEAPERGARVRCNQGEMAAALGVTRESVNKHLGRLKARGIIEMEAGSVVLRDAAALRGMAAAL